MRILALIVFAVSCNAFAQLTLPYYGPYSGLQSYAFKVYDSSNNGGGNIAIWGESLYDYGLRGDSAYGEGVYASSTSNNAMRVLTLCTASNCNGIVTDGPTGISAASTLDSSSGRAIYGMTQFNSGTAIVAETTNTGQGATSLEAKATGRASYFHNTGTTTVVARFVAENASNSNAVLSLLHSGAGSGIEVSSNSSYRPTIDVAQSGSGTGVYSYTGGTNSTAISGVANGNPSGVGVRGQSYTSYGVSGVSTYGSGVYALSTSGYGVQAASTSSSGVTSTSSSSNGVQGTSSSTSASGVYGENISTSGYGVAGRSAAAGAAILGDNTSSSGWSGYFTGRGHFTGNLDKAGGGFKIDHPLDPANQYLWHSFVESPERRNFYDGVVVLNASGVAIVSMPAYFSALNKDVRYQLTCIGGFAPVYVAQEMTAANTFTIAGGVAGLKVSWQLTGTRKDAWALANPASAEQPKVGAELGRYLHPTLFGQPESKSIDALMRPAAAPSTP